MTVTGAALIVIAVAVCVLVAALIPTILAARRTFASVGCLSEMIQCELKPAIRELTGALTEIKTISSEMAEHNGDVSRFMYALGETGDNLLTINRSVGTVTGLLNASNAWIAGAKVAGKYMLERYLKKRGGY